MRADLLPHLRCPACGGTLEGEDLVERDGELVSGTLRCECDRSFRIENGIADFSYPDQLEESDQLFKDEYDRRAGSYDADMVWQFEVFDQDKNEVRRSMIDLMELEPGMKVLETGAGTGEDSVHILDDIGEAGFFVAQDLSPPMLEEARTKLSGRGAHVEYQAGNASYLPFEDDFFDAYFHFGGLNGFGETRRAIEEATRVVRPGGRVVVGDEGIAPWLRRRLYGKLLIRTNQLYKNRPPMEMLPVEARNVALRWLLGDAFYVISYDVGEGSLPLNIDLRMPRKGDTLRSRYYGTDPASPPSERPKELS